MTSQLDELAANTAATMTAYHPDYTPLAARIVVSNLYNNIYKSFSEMVKDMYNHVNDKSRLKASFIVDDVLEIIMKSRIHYLLPPLQDLQSKVMNYGSHHELLELVESKLEELNVNHVSVDSLVQLEEHLETSLSVTRARKVGVGSFILHQFFTMVNMILVNFGLSEDMYNPSTEQQVQGVLNLIDQHSQHSPISEH